MKPASFFISEGKLLLEINRILRPGGYFILSTKHNSIEEENGQALSFLFYCLLCFEYRNNVAICLPLKIIVCQCIPNMNIGFLPP